MNSKTSARVVGALFLTATAAGVLSVVLLGPLDTLSAADIAGSSSRISAGALMVLVMAGAIALIPPMLFPVLKQHGEGLALGYVVARTLEVVLVLPAAISPLVIVATNGDAAYRVLSRTQDVWAYSGSSIFFCLSVLLLNSLLYKSKFVPRWLSGWAIVAVVPYLADALLVMFGVHTVSSAIHTFLVVPLALSEMVLAVWLLSKGFVHESVRPGQL
jgi:hypothetical protein